MTDDGSTQNYSNSHGYPDAGGDSAAELRTPAAGAAPVGAAMQGNGFPFSELPNMLRMPTTGAAPAISVTSSRGEIFSISELPSWLWITLSTPVLVVVTFSAAWIIFPDRVLVPFVPMFLLAFTFMFVAVRSIESHMRSTARSAIIGKAIVKQEGGKDYIRRCGQRDRAHLTPLLRNAVRGKQKKDALERMWKREGVALVGREAEMREWAGSHEFDPEPRDIQNVMPRVHDLLDNSDCTRGAEWVQARGLTRLEGEATLGAPGGVMFVSDRNYIAGNGKLVCTSTLATVRMPRPARGTLLASTSGLVHFEHLDWMGAGLKSVKLDDRLFASGLSVLSDDPAWARDIITFEVAAALFAGTLPEQGRLTRELRVVVANDWVSVRTEKHWERQIDLPSLVLATSHVAYRCAKQNH